jgi:hypothetical protein
MVRKWQLRSKVIRLKTIGQLQNASVGDSKRTAVLRKMQNIRT